MSISALTRVSHAGQKFFKKKKNNNKKLKKNKPFEISPSSFIHKIFINPNGLIEMRTKKRILFHGEEKCKKNGRKTDTTLIHIFFILTGYYVTGGAPLPWTLKRMSCH